MTYMAAPDHPLELHSEMEDVVVVAFVVACAHCGKSS